MVRRAGTTCKSERDGINLRRTWRALPPQHVLCGTAMVMLWHSGSPMYCLTAIQQLYSCPAHPAALSHLPLAQCDGLYHLAGVAILHLTHHLLQRF